MKKHRLVYSTKTKPNGQLFYIYLQMVHALQCVHLHYLCLWITKYPNVCINISNQGPLPLVRDEKGKYPWEKRERGALHSKQMSMLKDNIKDSYIDGDDASPPGHPASYSPGYQRLQKKPKVASYITLRPCTMLQAILCSFFEWGWNTFRENIVSGPEVVDNEVAPLSESEHPLPLGIQTRLPHPN